MLDVYDFRFDRKLYQIRSSYNEPINSISFVQDHCKSVIISNKKQIKVSMNEGEFFTSIEPDSNVNMFTVVENSGLILAAMEDPKIGCYFIPQLGSAPKWVPYIENITEELEESQKKMVYNEYKFVTKQEVFELGCTNLLGTKMLKEYMHGYLMHLRLYNKVKGKLELINYNQSRSNRVTKAAEDQAPKAVQEK